jgi:hypothetical protein
LGISSTASQIVGKWAFLAIRDFPTVSFADRHCQRMELIEELGLI